MTLGMSSNEGGRRSRSVSGEFELVPDEHIFVDMIEFEAGRRMRITDAQGESIASITLNPKSNRCDQRGRPYSTYTLRVKNGYEILLPVPSRFSTEEWKEYCGCGTEKVDADFVTAVGSMFHCDFELRLDETGVEVHNACKLDFLFVDTVQGSPPNNLVVLPTPDFELTQDWQEVKLLPGDYMALYEGKVVSGAIFARADFSHRFVYRSMDGSENIILEEGLPKTFEMGPMADIFAVVDRGRLFVRNNGEGCCQPFRIINSLWSVDQGMDGEFSASINGGGLVAGSTYKKLGGHKHERGSNVNEDSVGIDFRRNRLLVADGVGGSLFGEGAASQVVKKVAVSEEESLMASFTEASRALWVYNYYFLSRQNNGEFPDIYCGGMSDTLLGVAELRANVCEVLTLGDIRAMQVRKGKIIAKSQIASLPGFAYDSGRISVEAFMNHEYRNRVATSMYSYFNPYRVIFNLEQGDKVVLWNDGVAMSEYELVNVVSENSPKKAVSIVNSETAKRNSEEEYETLDEKGDKFFAESPKDNTTLIVYEH